MNCSRPGPSVHGILQARILEWIALPSSRGSSWPRNRIHISCVSCIGTQILYHWATSEASQAWDCFSQFMCISVLASSMFLLLSFPQDHEWYWSLGPRGRNLGPGKPHQGLWAHHHPGLTLSCWGRWDLPEYLSSSQILAHHLYTDTIIDTRAMLDAFHENCVKDHSNSEF